MIPRASNRGLLLSVLGVCALAVLMSACGSSSTSSSDSSKADSKPVPKKTDGSNSAPSRSAQDVATRCDEEATRTFFSDAIKGHTVDSIVCGDVTGDGRVDYAATLYASDGPGNIDMYAIATGDAGARSDGYLVLALKNPAERAHDLKIVNKRLVVTIPNYKASDALCCPSSESTQAITWKGTTFANELISTVACATTPNGGSKCESASSDDSAGPGSRGKAQNLTVTDETRASLRAAFIASGNRKPNDVKGPLPGQTYYGSYNGKEWALATFSIPLTFTDDQPEVFRRPVGASAWNDLGDTGGDLCGGPVPLPMLKVWQLADSCD